MTAMTYGEKIAYQRGYNRARRNFANRAARAVEIAKGYRSRSALPTDTEQRCAGCARWSRGGPDCVWGKCAANFEYSLEGRMWVDQFVGENERRVIITTAEFGCVNWLPKGK